MKRCFECDGLALHEHHVIPRSMGGTRTVPLCEGCHGKVHGRDLVRMSELCRRVMAGKKARGERVGEVPYGSRLADDGLHLEPVAEEQAVIARARELRAAGLSLAAVGAKLALDGKLSRAGTSWHPQQIARMLA